MESDLIYLSDVVDEYLSQYRLPDSHQHRLMRLGIRGRKWLHTYSCGKQVTVPLEVQADNTAKIPCDSLNLVSLYVDLGEGKKLILEENDNLSLPNCYTKDETNWLIKLSSSFEYSELMCDYLPQATQDGDYIIHPLFEEVLINWLIWQDGRGNPKISRGSVKEDRHEFFESHRLAKKALKPFSLDQMYKNYQRTATNNLSVFNAN